jgi:hypothetical protein
VYQAAIERQHRLYETVIGVDPDIGPALTAAVYRRQGGRLTGPP